MIITKHLYSVCRHDSDDYPVMIRIEHNGIVNLVPTSVSCSRENWVSAKCCVSEADGLHRIKNETIESQFRRVAGIIQDHLDNYLSANLKSICETMRYDRVCEPFEVLPPSPPTESPQTELPTILKLIEMKIETVSTLNTRRGYLTLLNYCKTIYGSDTGPDYINRGFITRFDLRLRTDFRDSQSTRHLMLARMRAVLNHARDIGILPSSSLFRLPKVPLRPRDRNLSNHAIKCIFHIFNDSVRDDPEFSRPTTFALALFVLDIAFQGLAPVDLASLRVGQVKKTFLYPPDSDYYVSAYTPPSGVAERRCLEVLMIRTSRQKTGQQVNIVASSRPLAPIINRLVKGKNDNDYLIPCFSSSRQYTPEQRQNRLANYFHRISCSINKAISRAKIVDSEHGEHRRVTFYYARHAFCNLIDSLDVPRHLIQYMIGHRTSVLETSYLRKITPWEQACLSDAILSPLLPDEKSSAFEK